MVLLHGIGDSARTWNLVLPALAREHEVLAPTLPGHLGGPPLPPGAGAAAMAGWVAAAMDDAGMATAHLVGDSMGGYLALLLAHGDRLGRRGPARRPGGPHDPGDRRGRRVRGAARDGRADPGAQRPVAGCAANPARSARMTTWA
jgi:pimeloyl-ACP methyl ester carboxylesterase